MLKRACPESFFLIREDSSTRCHSESPGSQSQEIKGGHLQITDFFDGYVKKKYLICIIKW